MSITAKKLSEILGLSATAISMALNNKPGVSIETRQAVIKAAEKYGYDFSKLSLKSTPEGEIYIIFYISANAIISYSPIFDELQNGLVRELKKENYRMKILYFYEKTDDINIFLGDIRTSDCIGIVLLGTELSENAAKQFLSLSIPTVILDSYFKCLDCNHILIDNYQGGYIATNYLIAHRRHQPGLLKSTYSLHNFRERELGFREALQANGMSYSCSVVHTLSPSIEGAFSDMLELLNQNVLLANCYFAENDLIAIGAMKAFKSKGYRIPQDIGIIGFDNISESLVVDPPLTTVNVSRIYMAEFAVKSLLNSIKNPISYTHKIQISTALIERSSI
ncbi:LacI family DNA-binding transcriptional regulator [Clostridium sp. SHJSY1]|uniref:LacI family DNA-binding transcriptional regulator n=1 Tax=Clostridium sp. SHJSY1 TaxID=2942483 RepID=UPI002876C021|nr:LacI family DNA-binding transcriptional regulator [Clostridium sp. SHJSY1]MDS0525810.1 LacI family DNA-binding transcriptional regulator [Clostridium sp. SHJSY1]